MFRKKLYFGIIVLLLSSLTLFSITLDEIRQLSKNKATLDNAWNEFLLYLSQNPTDPSVRELGEILSIKRFFLNKYTNRRFVDGIVEENLNKFLSGLMSFPGVFKEEETEKLLKIFPEILTIMNRIFKTGVMDNSLYRYLYKLKGLKNILYVDTYEPFLRVFVDKSINYPATLDDALKNFIKEFIPKNVVKKINNIIDTNRFIVNEEYFIGLYKFLDFLKEMEVLSDKNLSLYTQMKNYFDLKKKLGELSTYVYIAAEDDLPLVVQDVEKVLKIYIAFPYAKSQIEKMLIGILRPLISRIESSKKILFDTIPDFPVEKIGNSELKKYVSNLKNVIKEKSIYESKNITKIEKQNQKEINTQKEEKSKSENKKKSKKLTITLYHIIILVVGLIFAVFLLYLLIIYIFPSYKRIEFMLDIGLKNFALNCAKRYVEKKPQDYKSFLALARVYEEMGEHEKAVEMYKAAMNIKKHSRRVF